MYDEIDMFDKTADAIEDAGNETLNCEKEIDIQQCTMEDYEFKETRKYSAIYIRWCLTYISRKEQIKFLKKAKKCIHNKD